MPRLVLALLIVLLTAGTTRCPGRPRPRWRRLIFPRRVNQSILLQVGTICYHSVLLTGAPGRLTRVTVRGWARQQ
jgi:hypothetical protein